MNKDRDVNKKNGLKNIRLKTLPVMFFMFFAIYLNAEDQSSAIKEKEYQAYLSIENESEISTENENNDIAFGGMENSSSLETGILFEINEALNIIPMMGFSDLIWNTSNTGVFSYSENTLFAGCTLEIIPLDFLQLNLGVSGFTTIEADSLISFGFEQTTGIGFIFEDIFIEANINNSISPSFESENTNLTDTISYDISFPFMNFIKEDINTGLYIEGELEFGNTFTGSNLDQTDITNEIFAGFYTNPIEPLSLHVLFAVYNEASYSNGSIIAGTKYNALGIKAGINISNDRFWTEINYIPRFGIYIDDSIQSVEHTFNICLGIDF